MSEPDESEFLSFLDFDNLIPTGEILPPASEQLSLMITQAQRAELREMGYGEAIIHVMKPEEAHRLLGLKAKGK